MADKDTPETPQPDEAEKAFWEKFTGTLDSWWDAKMKTVEPPPAPPKDAPPEPGKSRTGGKRLTLPDLIADMVFGPPKE